MLRPLPTTLRIGDVMAMDRDNEIFRGRDAIDS
jgi:hypothetical protein